MLDGRFRGRRARARARARARGGSGSGWADPLPSEAGSGRIDRGYRGRSSSNAGGGCPGRPSWRVAQSRAVRAAPANRHAVMGGRAALARVRRILSAIRTRFVERRVRETCARPLMRDSEPNIARMRRGGTPSGRSFPLHRVGSSRRRRLTRRRATRHRRLRRPGGCEPAPGLLVTRGGFTPKYRANPPRTLSPVDSSPDQRRSGRTSRSSGRAPPARPPRARPCPPRSARRRPQPCSPRGGRPRSSRG